MTNYEYEIIICNKKTTSYTSAKLHCGYGTIRKETVHSVYARFKHDGVTDGLWCQERESYKDVTMLQLSLEFQYLMFSSVFLRLVKLCKYDKTTEELTLFVQNLTLLSLNFKNIVKQW